MTTHTHLHGNEPPYEHSHADPTCTHRWVSCPVHGLPGGELPPFRVVLTCIVGGAELKDGGTWDQDTSDSVVDRLCDRFDPARPTTGEPEA